MTDLEMTLATHTPKATKPKLKLGVKYRIEVPHPAYGRWDKATVAFKESIVMRLIDFRDGGVVVAQEPAWVPANVKPTDPSYACMLLHGEIKWKRGFRLRRIKRSWIKEEVSG